MRHEPNCPALSGQKFTCAKAPPMMKSYSVPVLEAPPPIPTFLTDMAELAALKSLESDRSALPDCVTEEQLARLIAAAEAR